MESEKKAGGDGTDEVNEVDEGQIVRMSSKREHFGRQGETLRVTCLLLTIHSRKGGGCDSVDVQFTSNLSPTL